MHFSQKQWIAIFQYPVVALLTSLATDFTQVAGVYCLDSDKPYFAHIWLTVITEVSVAFAVISVITFYRTLKSQLASHRPLSKLLAFKLIVGLTFLERIIFTVLRSTNALKSTATLSYADVDIGIPNLVVCLQMVPFSIFFHCAYNVGPYKLRNQNESYHPSVQEAEQEFHGKSDLVAIPLHYKGGPLGVRAWIGLFNPMEICRAIKFGFYMTQKAGSRDKRGENQIELGYLGREPMMPESDSQGREQVSYERLLNPGA
ncbi:hypothetical protein N7520_011927 [Penicillium odoratum]|uniref:uncharacterized protein n=1 Tax=Penicillium odoratum TaxID=1167516 RepID=UPI0025483426|nr:uncharacterized protein N7520_011927 [Penicillium odoratum]KAJ5746745.1 hypothetical protein N7520_011927 [Penicillium odoratum]